MIIEAPDVIEDTEIETSEVIDDEELDRLAQGESVTSDAMPVGTGEVDAIGRAAGLVEREDRPFHGIAEVERRDQHRWENEAISEDNPNMP